MLLIAAATTFEMEAFKACAPDLSWMPLITGIGPVEAAVQTTRLLASSPDRFQAVINIGVAGAYVRDGGEGAELLDICLAEREVLGDLGICFPEAVAPLGHEALEVVNAYELDAPLRTRAEEVLDAGGIPFRRGVFVTVSCVSGFRRRGTDLARQHRGLCENMEGAAVARACQLFGLPLLELRCISNLVEDRELANWQLKQACARCGQAAALVTQGLIHA